MDRWDKHTSDVFQRSERSAQKNLISNPFLFYWVNLLQFEKTQSLRGCPKIWSQKVPLTWRDWRQVATAIPAVFQDTKLGSCPPSLTFLLSSLQVCHHPLKHCKKMKEVFHIPFLDGLVVTSRFRKLRECGRWILQHKISVPYYTWKFKCIHFIRKEGPLSLISWILLCFSFLSHSEETQPLDKTMVHHIKIESFNTRSLILNPLLFLVYHISTQWKVGWMHTI